MSYTNLLADINTWIQNQSVELTAERDQIITNALTTLTRELPIQPFITAYSAAFTIGSPTLLRSNLTRPVAIREISYTTAAGSYVKLQQRQESYCRAYAPIESATGDPKFYYVNRADQWNVTPTPSAALTYTIEYLQRPLLDVTTTTNWLTENAYPLLLSATLEEACRFAQAVDQRPELLQQYQAQHQAELALVRGNEFKLEMDAAKIQ